MAVTTLVVSVLGGISIKKRYTGILYLSLFGAGIFMALFGMRENIVLIGVAGFLFCAILLSATPAWTSAPHQYWQQLTRSVHGG